MLKDRVDLQSVRRVLVTKLRHHGDVLLAALFIGIDSAPMHIASAMQTSVVALFGPSGEFNWGSWQVPHRVIASGHDCRPCGNDGGGKVSECLTALPVPLVLQAVQTLQSR